MLYEMEMLIAMFRRVNDDATRRTDRYDGSDN